MCLCAWKHVRVSAHVRWSLCLGVYMWLPPRAGLLACVGPRVCWVRSPARCFVQLIATVPRQGNEHLLSSGAQTSKDGMAVVRQGQVVRGERGGLLLWRTAPLTLSCRGIAVDGLRADPEVVELLRQRSEAEQA